MLLVGLCPWQGQADGALGAEPTTKPALSAGRPDIRALFAGVRGRDDAALFAAWEKAWCMRPAEVRQHLPEVLEGLGDADWRVRKVAIELLDSAGPSCEKGVEALIAALQHKSKSTRNAAKWQLQKFAVTEAFGLTARPYLLKALSFRHEFAQKTAAKLLAAARPVDDKLVMAILRATTNSDFVGWSEAVDTLASFGPHAIGPLVAASRSTEREIADHAIFVLARVYPTKPPAVRALTSALAVPALRTPALNALWRMGVGAEEAVPAVVPFVKAEEAKVRQAAVSALGAIGVRRREAVGPLASVLGKGPMVTCDALTALGEMGPLARPATPAVLRLLKGADDARIIRVTRVLAKIADPDDRAVASALRNLLLHASTEIPWPGSNQSPRGAAATALVALGHTDAQAIAELVVRGEYGRQRLDAASLLRAGPTGMKALKKALQSPDDWEDEEIWRAARAIGEAPAKASQTLGMLLALAKSKREVARLAATWALGELGKTNDQALATMANALQDKSHCVRHVAAKALGRMGPRASCMVPNLIRAMPDPGPGEVDWNWLLSTEGKLDGAIVEAFGRIGPGARQAVAALTAAAVKQHDMDALDSLVQIGPAAKQAAPALRAVLKDVDEYTLAVATALLKLDPTDDTARSWLEKKMHLKRNPDRMLVIQAIGKAGPAAKAALPMLRKALKDEYWEARHAAKVALANVQAR